MFHPVRSSLVLPIDAESFAVKRAALAGSSGNDTLYGTDDADQLQGLAGDDILIGYGGNDSLYGADGDDSIDAGDGDDLVYGGNGDDTIDLGYGNDTLWAGDNDTGNDEIRGSWGDDVLGGNGGNDTILGGSGNDTAFGGAGDDYLYGSGMGRQGIYHNVLWGGDGNDRLQADRGGDTLASGAGNDTCFGGAGDDEMWGGPQVGPGITNDDYFDGDYGNDRIYGAVGNDTIKGFYGDDLLYGGAGDDLIQADNGADTIYGGTGSDTIQLGNDFEQDTVVIEKNSGFDYISSFERTTDLLVFENLPSSIDSKADLMSIAREGNLNGRTGVILDFSANDKLVLTGLTLDEFSRVKTNLPEVDPTPDPGSGNPYIDLPASWESGGRVREGETYHSEIGTSSDTDWIIIPSNRDEGATYIVEIRGASTGDGTLDFPDILKVYDPNGYQVEDITFLASTGNNIVAEIYTYAPGNYAIEVASKYGDTGTYEVALTYAGPPPEIPASNQTYTTVSADTDIHSDISAPDDVDWIAWYMEGGVHYQIDLHAESSDFDPLIYGIYDESGNPYTGLTDDNSGPGNDARLPVSANVSGTVYIAVAGTDGSIGDYLLTITEV